MSATVFTIRRKVFSLFGAKFHMYNAEGGLLGFCRQKAFKLKEDIRIFTDESMAEERLAINARAVLDFGAAYDITDSATQQRIGALQRQGFKSTFFRDEWTVFDENEVEIGRIREDSAFLAMIRRTIFKLIPQTFHLKDASDELLAEYRTHFNPFVHKMTVTVYPECPVNPFLVLAGAVLLIAIEGRQQ